MCGNWEDIVSNAAETEVGLVTSSSIAVKVVELSVERDLSLLTASSALERVRDVMIMW
jgi:hypothetical protein